MAKLIRKRKLHIVKESIFDAPSVDGIPIREQLIHTVCGDSAWDVMTICKSLDSIDEDDICKICLAKTKVIF